MDHSFELVLQKASELPRTVTPMLEYAKVLQPDAVIICDRDARPLGYALEQLVAHSETPLFLQDKLWYRRISKKLARDAIAAHCKALYDSLLDIEKPTILVVDDHISRQGTTASLFRAATTHAGLKRADIHWTTLTGKGTALNLRPFASPALEAPWRDRADILGIDYQGNELVVAPTELSVEFYETIATAAQDLAQGTLQSDLYLV
jgi:hypothetical protein